MEPVQNQGVLEIEVVLGKSVLFSLQLLFEGCQLVLDDKVHRVLQEVLLQYGSPGLDEVFSDLLVVESAISQECSRDQSVSCDVLELTLEALFDLSPSSFLLREIRQESLRPHNFFVHFLYISLELVVLHSELRKFLFVSH